MTEPTVTRTKVRFGSHGVDCAGYLYRPAKARGTLPCVVLGHGTAGTMDRLFVYAEPFAAAGMAVLVFDYRGWGASDGQPRQVIDIGGQLDDWRAAIGFAVRGARGRPPYLVPIVGEPGQTALFTGPEVKEALEAKGLEGSLWRNEFAPRFVFVLPRYQPGRMVEQLGMPLLVCVADRDRETPADFAARFIQPPRADLRRYPASHFEMYYGETFKRVLADQVDFLRSHLLSETAGHR
jgi:fermentation-respiration switch protein FrsA (DUF1100 family)